MNDHLKYTFKYICIYVYVCVCVCVCVYLFATQIVSELPALTSPGSLLERNTECQKLHQTCRVRMCL